MFKQGKKILLGAGVLAAISFGGTALSAAGAAPVTPVVQHATGEAQEGQDTEINDAPEDSGETATPEGAGDGETQDGPRGQDAETMDGPSESGSEVPGNDGPGGHADEPGQPNAQNQE